MKYTQSSNIQFITILFIIFVSAAEIDICVPSFPQIQAEFHLSAFKTEILLGANLLFHCLAALLVGNLGDKYGKKKVINIGFITFILGSAVCFFAGSYYMLVAGRIIQGIGVAASLVLAPIIIMELYQEKAKQQKMMAMLNGFVTLAMCMAPTIGSYTTLLFNWRSNFVLLTVFGCLALAMFNTFIRADKAAKPETKLSIKEYGVVFQSNKTLLYIIGIAFITGAYYTFVGMASIIYVESFGVSLKDFGLYQGSLTLTFGVVSIFSGSMMQKFGNKLSFIVSMILTVLFLVICLWLVVFNIQNPLYITAAILLLSIGVVMPCNMLYLFGLNSIAGASGKISSIFTVGKWLFTVVGIQTASYFYAHDFRSTGILMFIMELAGVVITLVLLSKDKKFYQEMYKPKQKKPITIEL